MIFISASATWFTTKKTVPTAKEVRSLPVTLFFAQDADPVTVTSLYCQPEVTEEKIDGVMFAGCVFPSALRKHERKSVWKVQVASLACSAMETQGEES